MRKLVDVFLGDALLLAFALLWLFLFVCVLVVPDHIIGVGENNLAILFLEIAICASVAVWAVGRVRHNIKRERNET